MQFKPSSIVNPVLVKELRSRMRGARAFVILTGVLLLLGAVCYALYRIVLATSQYARSPLSPQIGQTLFIAIVFLELMMVCFITPAVTAGAISGEREKLTYEVLLATPLRPASILWGKLVSALSYVFLLIFAAVPMASLVFIFGGVAPRDMIKALVILVAVAVMLGVVGIFMSVWLGRTGRATVLSYLAVLAVLVGPVFVYILVGVLRRAEPPRWILVPNPVSALFSALTPAMSISDSLGGLLWGLGMALGGNLGTLTDSGGQVGIPRPLYHYSLPLYGVVTLVLYLLATRMVRPIRRWRIGWKEVLAALAMFLLLGGVVALAFVSTADRYERVSILSAPTPVPQPVFVEREVVRVVEVEPTEPPRPVPTPTPTPTPTSTPTVSVMESVTHTLAASIPGPTKTYTETYTGTDRGFAFDYPADWYLVDTPGWQITLTSYDPESSPGMGGMLPEQAKIDVVRLGRTVEELAANARADADQVLWEEQWEVAGAPAVRMQIVGMGEMALLITTINGHSLQMQGYGDLGLFDPIVRTLRPIP